MAADPRADAEARWRAVIDAQAADLRAVRRGWSHRERPEVTEALRRLRARAAPDGDADAAMGVVLEAYEGDVPVPVRRRLERYIVEHLHSGQPTGTTDPEDDGEPAVLRTPRRRRREEGATDAR